MSASAATKSEDKAFTFAHVNPDRQLVSRNGCKGSLERKPGQSTLLFSGLLNTMIHGQPDEPSPLVKPGRNPRAFPCATTAIPSKHQALTVMKASKNHPSPPLYNLRLNVQPSRRSSRHTPFNLHILLIQLPLIIQGKLKPPDPSC